MKKPEFITFTGIDDRTDLTRADGLAGRYDIEWGVLLSNNKDARYPCNQAVAEIMKIFGPKSAHLCGKLSRDIQAGAFSSSSLDPEGFWRIQVNGSNIDTSNLDSLAEWANARVIVQRTDGEFIESDRHELFDCSGGRGVMPESIPETRSDQVVGFAGGMGPDTVADYLTMIKGDGRFWIDMESNVRTDGWFDLDKVERVCQIVYGY